MSAWITKSEVAQITGWTARHIERQASIGDLASRESKKLSRNGRTHREYAVASLPSEAQRVFLEKSLAMAAARQPGDKESGLIAASGLQTANQRLQSGIFDSAPELANPHRAILPPALEKQAQERYEAIAPLLNFDKLRGSAAPELRSLGVFVKWIAKQRNISERSLWRWYSRFKSQGWTALADRDRSDKDQSRYFVDNPVLAEFAQKKYLAERLSFRAVHEALDRECRGRRIDPPSYSTVRVYLTKLPKVLQIIARDGERQYHDRCEMFVVKKYTDRLANDIWVSDHMIHDVWTRNDIFPDHPADAPIRPWLTAIIDYRTRKLVGFVHCATPSSDTISAALRVAISQFGPPKTFYIDNGKDYKSLGRENALSPQASGVLVRLGVESQYCQPLHPQSKHIERFFRTLHERFDRKWIPFYSGTSPKDRPEECDRMLAEHKKLMKAGNVEQSSLPLASEFIQVAAQWVREYNAFHKHSGRGMNGQSPDEVFDAEYPVGQRRACDPRALDILLRRREVLVVREGGCIQLGGHRYEPADASSSAAMTLQIEQRVLIACDPANMGEAVAMDLDGHFLGTLQASKLMEHGPVSRDEIRASMRQRRLAKRAMKDYVGGLVARSYARGEQSEIELLRDRAGLAAQPQRVQRTRLLAAASAIPSVAAAPVGYDDVADRFFEEEG
jgi:putative transposase